MRTRTRNGIEHTRGEYEQYNDEIESSAYLEPNRDSQKQFRKCKAKQSSLSEPNYLLLLPIIVALPLLGILNAG